MSVPDRGQGNRFDPNVQMFKTFEKFPHIGTNGGTAAGLVGSYDTVAEHVIPRVRNHHAARV
jgi:hypothetical protein